MRFALPLERLFGIAILAAALVVIAATAAHVLQLRDSLFSEADVRLRTLSRVLAGQVNHELGTLETAFEQMEQPLQEALQSGNERGVATLLRSLTQRELLLRELAVVDVANGVVLASSQAASIGTNVSGYDFARSAGSPRRFIGIPKQGRGLSAGTGQEGPEHARAGFITFSWRMSSKHDHHMLVAVIGADSLINDLRYIAGGDVELLTVYRYDGAVLAASDDIEVRRTAAHPIFERFLPEREADSFIETGDDGRRWVAHFATAGDFPLVVEARLSESVLLSGMPGRLVVPLGLMTVIVIALFLYRRLIASALRERRQQEDALREARDAADKAAGANARFLAVMSHELRTPMTGILGMADLLEDARLQPEQARFLHVLRSSAQSLLGVLNDVLDYSKIDAGRLELETIAFDPLVVVREVVDLLSPAAVARDNRIRQSWDPTAFGLVRGDPTRLRQVMVNLIGNAIKFTEHGTITVTVTRLEPSTPERLGIRFEVSDTGIGISPSVLPMLFHPFQQADATTSRRFGGTGLGLAICRHLVEAMGGRIGVDGITGGGSRFWLELQLPQEAEPPAATRQPVADSAGNTALAARPLRILVAEDNPTIRLLISTRLSRSGHQVELAADGAQAVAALHRAEHDLVLMDMQMPGVDGLEAARRIRALPGPPGRVPIIAITADVTAQSRADARRAGIDDYLLKPIDWSELERAIAAYALHVLQAAPTAFADSAAAPRSADLGASKLAGAALPIGTDAAALAAARENLGEDVHLQLLDVYWRQAAFDQLACRAAIARGDSPARAAAAHSLKGASVSVGLESVAAAAGHLETCAAADAAQALRFLDERIAATFAEWTRTHGAKMKA
jgi:signal transduction histidine kinase/response regulator of citrate/malate metabolism